MALRAASISGASGALVGDGFYLFDDSIAIGGDSRGVRNQSSLQYSLQGDFTTGNLFLQQKFNLIGVYANSGDSIETFVATNLPLLIASGAKNALIYIGTNNIASDSVATVISKLRSLVWAPLTAAGINIIMATLAPFSGWTSQQNSQATQVNDAIRREAFVRGGFIVFDQWRAVVNAQTGLYKTGLSQDGEHNNAAGGCYGGREFAATVSPYFTKTTSQQSGGALDPLIITSNPLMYGNNASGGVTKYNNGTGTTGSGPTSCGVLTTNARTTAVCTGAIARGDYIDGQGLQVAMAFGADDDSIQVRPAPNGGTSDIFLARPWSATAAKSFGELLTRSNGVRDFQFKNITYPNGTTGSTEPTWGTPVIGQTFTDGSITWMCIAEPVGNLYEMISDVMFTALSGSIAPTFSISCTDASFAGINFNAIVNNVSTPLLAATLNSPTYVAGTPIFDTTAFPLNQMIRLRSQAFFPPAGIVHFSPTLRVFGKNGTTATMVVYRAEVRQVVSY